MSTKVANDTYKETNRVEPRGTLRKITVTVQSLDIFSISSRNLGSWSPFGIICRSHVPTGLRHSISFLYTPVVVKNSIPETWKTNVFLGPNQVRNDVCETVRDPWENGRSVGKSVKNLFIPFYCNRSSWWTCVNIE
jgi:hypothetical protein